MNKPKITEDKCNTQFYFGTDKLVKGFRAYDYALVLTATAHEPCKRFYTKTNTAKALSYFLKL